MISSSNEWLIFFIKIETSLLFFFSLELWGDDQQSSHTYENCSFNATGGSFYSNIDTETAITKVNVRSNSPDPFDTSRIYGKLYFKGQEFINYNAEMYCGVGIYYNKLLLSLWLHNKLERKGKLLQKMKRFLEEKTHTNTWKLICNIFTIADAFFRSEKSNCMWSSKSFPFLSHFLCYLYFGTFFSMWSLSLWLVFFFFPPRAKFLLGQGLEL